jgi:hypothetical protein
LRKARALRGVSMKHGTGVDGLHSIVVAVTDAQGECIGLETQHEEDTEDEHFSISNELLQKGNVITVMLRGKTDEEPPRYWVLPIDVRII